MNRRTFLKTASVAALGSAAVGAAAADPDRDRYRPGGPVLGSPKSINLDGFRTNEQLAAELQRIERRSGRLSLREIARSAGRNDPVWEVQVGGGDTDVHLITQIHGDEPTGTEAILEVIRSLATGDGRRVDRILENLSFTIVPRVNPDGAMYRYDVDDDGDDEWVARRYNTQAWSGESEHRPYYHYESPPGGAPGYDMNRDFNIRPPGEFDPRADDDASWWEQADGEWYMDMAHEGHTLSGSGLRLTPEVRGVTESFVEADPDYAITHHHKGGSLYPDSEEENRPQKQSLLSVMAAYGESYLDRSPFYPADHEPVTEAVNPFLDEATSTRSIRLNALVIEALAERGDSIFDSVTRYGYFPLWGSYLDAMCPNLANGGDSAAGMLYEVAYQTDDLGQKALGRMLELTRRSFLESFDALAADPDLADYDAETYFDTPLFGEGVQPR